MKPIEQQELVQIVNTYDAFATLFLTLPDEKLLRQIRLLAKGEQEAQTQGDKLMAAYAVSSMLKTDEAVLQEIGVDRVHLLRGLLKEDPCPPYESRYVSMKPEDCNASIMESYLEAGIAPVLEVHETPDQLGVQFNFLATVYRRAYMALEAGDAAACEKHMQMADAFFCNHPGRWAMKFADTMYRHARTDFYRGVAAMLIDWLQMEQERTKK